MGVGGCVRLSWKVWVKGYPGSLVLPVMQGKSFHCMLMNWLLCTALGFTLYCSQCVLIAFCSRILNLAPLHLHAPSASHNRLEKLLARGTLNTMAGARTRSWCPCQHSLWFIVMIIEINIFNKQKKVTALLFHCRGLNVGGRCTH